MQIEQTRWIQGKAWTSEPLCKLGINVHLVLLFGNPTCLKQTLIGSSMGQLARHKPAIALLGILHLNWHY